GIRSSVPKSRRENRRGRKLVKKILCILNLRRKRLRKVMLSRREMVVRLQVQMKSSSKMKREVRVTRIGCTRTAKWEN
uniref:Ovule protein n=1 Tax=Bursaphelenchus xylophilus TaxID=6326 RepID=A0A1I7SPC7_BURXY